MMAQTTRKSTRSMNLSWPRNRCRSTERIIDAYLSQHTETAKHLPVHPGHRRATHPLDLDTVLNGHSYRSTLVAVDPGRSNALLGRVEPGESRTCKISGPVAALGSAKQLRTGEENQPIHRPDSCNIMYYGKLPSAWNQVDTACIPCHRGLPVNGAMSPKVRLSCPLQSFRLALFETRSDYTAGSLHGALYSLLSILPASGSLTICSFCRSHRILRPVRCAMFAR